MNLMPVISIVSALCVIPALVLGAVSDIRSRTFPKAYWVWPARLAGICTILLYLLMFSNGFYELLFILVTGSVVCAVVCLVIGYRYGSGGDWRAMAYISILTPWLLPAFAVSTMIFSFIIAIVALIRPSDELDPIFTRHIPFALAILLGYIAALLIHISGNPYLL